jgi:hypothetical protein
MSLVLGGALLALGCQTRNAEKCEQGFSVTRQAVGAKDFALAKQWREFAYKMCDPAGDDKENLVKLDQEITGAEAAVKAAADAEAARKAKNDALLKLFVTWAGDNRAAPDKASAAPVCDTPTDATEKATVERTKERFCTGTRSAGENALSARYWEAEPKLARFSTKFASPVSCADFGAAESKSFEVPSTSGVGVKRSLCQITSGSLSGMSVVVSAANNADAYIFDPGVLEKDRLMKQIAGG